MKRIPLHYFCMSDISIIKTLTSRTIDPAIFGWPTNLLTAVAGTPTVSGGNYRLNVASFRSTFQVLYGQFSFGITVPTPPGPGDLRRWGLKGYPDTKGEAYFDLTADVFSLNVVSDKGVSTSVVVPFDITWPTMEIDFGISMEERSVVFTADGSIIGRIEVAIGDAITSPTYIFVDNAGADDMDVGYIKMKNVGRIVYENAPFNSITPGTGATSLGKAIGDAAASGDVGVAGLARRQDTPAALESDGDWVPETVEGAKGTRMTLGSSIRGEDHNRNRLLVVDGGTSTRITTATTTVCRNTSGRLNGAYVEVALTGTATFYDNASAASGTTPWILPIGTVAGWHEFRGATMSNGVVCVTSAADRLVVNTDA